MIADALSPAEAAILKAILISGAECDSSSPLMHTLIERGHLRIEGARVLVTVKGHVAYLKTLPAQFGD